jgi:hypothetical protein
VPAFSQAVGVLILLVCIVTWGLQFMVTGVHQAVPLFSDRPTNYAPVLSTLLYNFAYVTTIPSCECEQCVKNGRAREEGRVGGL